MAAAPFNYISLCAGGGGLDLAVKLALADARLVCAVEYQAFAAGRLAARMDEGCLDDAAIWSDLKSFDGRPWRGRVHLLTGGFPCQPFSHAGRRRGGDDPRHLWPYIAKLIEQIRPRYVFLENVPGLLSTRIKASGEFAAELVLRELRGLGYTPEVGLFSSEETGAAQIRERLFIFAVADADESIVCVGHGERARQQPQHEPDIGVGRQADVARGGGAASGRDIGSVPCSQGTSSRAGSLDRGCADGPGDGCGSLLPVAVPLGESQGQRRGEGRAQPSVQRGRRAASSDGESVGDTSPGGRSGRAQEQKRRARERAFVEWAKRLPLSPPGPGAIDAWRAIVKESPTLAPAVKRTLRGMADALADRIHRIRILGNGVDPMVGAYALRTLSARLAGRGNAHAADLVHLIESTLLPAAHKAGWTLSAESREADNGAKNVA